MTWDRMKRGDWVSVTLGTPVDGLGGHISGTVVEANEATAIVQAMPETDIVEIFRDSDRVDGWVKLFGKSRSAKQ